MKLTSLLLTGAMLMSSIPVVNVSAYGGGAGTQDNPYLIASAADWNEFTAYIKSDDDQGTGEYWRLAADIDFADDQGNQGWIAPIGNCGRDGDGTAFKGNLNGNGYLIKNYLIDCDGSLGEHRAFGLFSGIGGDAVIENLGIENPTLRIGADWWWIAGGALAGIATGNAQIQNCYVKNFSDEHSYNEGHFSYKGGLIGRIKDNVSVTNCYSLGYNPTACDNCSKGSGIIGTISSVNTALTNCYSDTTIAMADAGAWGPLWYNMYYPDTTELPWPGTYYSENEPRGYIGDRQTEEQLKAVPDNVKGIFVADTEINNGYPVLKWQKQRRVLSGAGTENDPYLIGDVNDLYTFAEMANTENKYFKLMTDIDLDNAIWTPIATEENPFKGDFDGNGHIIKNYRINLVTDKQSYGFFAYTGGKSCIHNLGIENVTAMLYQWHWNEMFGGLVGTMTGDANVRECYAKKVRHELQWDPWPLISAHPEGQGQFHTSGGLIGVLDGGGVEVARCYALDVERDYKTGSGDYEGQIYGYSMFDSGLIGRGEVFRSVTDCYSDTFVVQSKMGTSVSGCWQTLNSGEWYPGYEWRETIADVRYLPWSWSSAYIPGNMYGEGYEKYPRLKWEYDNGKYLNYVKEGRMTKENLSSIFDAENATRQFIWETNRVSIVMYLPLGSHIAYDVNLSADKYYKVSFKARSLNDNRRLNLDFSLGDTDLTELLQDKTIANTWETTAVYVKPSESGIFKLGIAGSDDMLVDDVEVVEVDADIETLMLNSSFSLYNKTQTLASDLYVQKKICDGVEVQYYSDYVAQDGTLRNIPIGLGKFDDTLNRVVKIADREISNQIPLTIKKTEPIDIINIGMTDADGNTVFDIKDAAKLDKIYTKINQTAENAKFYAALYKNSRLVNVKVYDIAEVIDANLAVDGADEVKLFIFTDKMQPLSDAEQSLPTLADDAKVTLHTIGDSLCATYAETNLLRGWGQLIGSKFNPDNVTVDNSLARGGMTAEEFVSGGRFEQLLAKLQAGDYVFIQLATNDNGKFTKTEFKRLLLQFVVGIREKDAIPVFVTAPERLTCATDETDENGQYKTVESLRGYPEMMREIGRERNVPVIDLNADTVEFMREHGLTGMKELDYFVSDELHFTKSGAEWLIDFIADGAKELKLPIAKFLVSE